MSLKNLSLRDLEYAVAVAEERHFGRAAARCHVSQPAPSVQVKKLEDVVGAQIFERTPRGVIVPEPGKELIRQAQLMLDEGPGSWNSLPPPARSPASSTSTRSLRSGLMSCRISCARCASAFPTSPSC